MAVQTSETPMVLSRVRELIASSAVPKLPNPTLGFVMLVVRI